MLVLTFQAQRNLFEYRLWDMNAEAPLLSGTMTGVGGFARHVYGYRHGHGQGITPVANHRAALELFMATLNTAMPSLRRVEGVEDDIVAVGHILSLPRRSRDPGLVVDDDVLAELRGDAGGASGGGPTVSLFVLQHAREMFPSLPHVAVFDDLATMATSREALSYAVRSSATRGELVARLGPGGLRVLSVVEKTLDMLDAESNSRLVIVDLDDVPQVTSVKGRSLIDTTHEFDGTSRMLSSGGPGAVSPGLRTALVGAAGDDEDVDDLLSDGSGLKCIEDEPLTMAGIAARLADGVYGPASRMLFDQVVREIGGQLTLMGGMEALVFTGAAGVSSPVMRAMIVTRLRIFQIHIDTQKNEQALGPTDITAPGGRIRVLVIPTDCSWQAALQASRIDHGGH